jgi:hypothetical protein
MPCFEPAPPVVTRREWPAPKPGLTRRTTSRPAPSSAYCSIMSGEPRFTRTRRRRSIASAARSNRSAVKSTSSGAKPAASARSTSPALTASTAQPCERTSASSARLELAFCA